MRTTAEPLLCNDLGELETCMGVEDEPSSCSFGRSFMPRAAHGSRLARAMQLASFAQEKIMVLSGKKLVKPVESSLTVFAPVGSAEWCGLPKDASASEFTPTQAAAFAWAARNKALGSERSESASVTSSAETVHAREREREPVSTIVHNVGAPDNINKLCIQYDVSAEELLSVNKPATRTSLLARKTIKIPMFEQDEKQHVSAPCGLANASRQVSPSTSHDDINACAASEELVVTQDELEFVATRELELVSRMRWECSISESGTWDGDTPVTLCNSALTRSDPVGVRLPSF